MPAWLRLPSQARQAVPSWSARSQFPEASGLPLVAFAPSSPCIIASAFNCAWDAGWPVPGKPPLGAAGAARAWRSAPTLAAAPAASPALSKAFASLASLSSGALRDGSAAMTGAIRWTRPVSSPLSASALDGVAWPVPLLPDNDAALAGLLMVAGRLPAAAVPAGTPPSSLSRLSVPCPAAARSPDLSAP